MDIKRSEIEKLLCDLVTIKSYVGSKHNEIGLQKYLITYMKKYCSNFKLKEIAFEGGRKNLLFQNGTKISILFACHLDTVPPSFSHAFDLRVVGDKAYGLGTKDMKGGIAATLLALKYFSDLPQGVGLLFYGDEETGTFKGINAVTQKRKLLFPQNPKLIVSPESKFDIGYGARGVVIMDITVKGIRAHSARPHLGVDAIKLLFNTTLKLEKNLNKTKSSLGNSFVTMNHFNGGLMDPQGKLYYHVGSIPDWAHAIISIRNASALSGEKILNNLKILIKNNNGRFEGKLLQDLPPRNTPKKIIKEVRKCIKNAGFLVSLGDPKLAGFNDMAILTQALNTHAVNFGPFGEGNHTKDEWVSINSIKNTAKIFQHLISIFCK